MTNNQAIELLKALRPCVASTLSEAMSIAINALQAQDLNKQVTGKLNFADDTISRQAALDWLKNEWNGRIATLFDGIKAFPSAQPERLTDDDFETIRIHLNAQKEKLCNQHRWEEANEYQRIINRFMAFASAQTEIVRCKECKWRNDAGHWLGCPVLNMDGDNYCSMAERGTDG